MARYEHLPIYRKTFELAVLIEDLVHGFSRHHKYGLGSRLQHAAVGLLERVVRAQNAGASGPPEEIAMGGSSGVAVFSFESLHRAYRACRRRKRSSPGALRFEMRLADELVPGSLRPGRRSAADRLDLEAPPLARSARGSIPWKARPPGSPPSRPPGSAAPARLVRRAGRRRGSLLPGGRLLRAARAAGEALRPSPGPASGRAPVWVRPPGGVSTKTARETHLAGPRPGVECDHCS
jgi:hypothetical protein